MVERKTSFLHVFSSEGSLSSLRYKCDIVFSVFFFSESKFNENLKNNYTFNNMLLISLKTIFIVYVIDLSTKYQM